MHSPAVMPNTCAGRRRAAAQRCAPAALPAAAHHACGLLTMPALAPQARGRTLACMRAPARGAHLLPGPGQRGPVQLRARSEANDAQARALNDVQVQHRLAGEDAQQVRAAHDARHQVPGDLGQAQRPRSQARVVGEGRDDGSDAEGHQDVGQQHCCKRAPGRGWAPRSSSSSLTTPPPQVALVALVGLLAAGASHLKAARRGGRGSRGAGKLIQPAPAPAGTGGRKAGRQAGREQAGMAALRVAGALLGHGARASSGRAAAARGLMQAAAAPAATAAAPAAAGAPAGGGAGAWPARRITSSDPSARAVKPSDTRAPRRCRPAQRARQGAALHYGP